MVEMTVVSMAVMKAALWVSYSVEWMAGKKAVKMVATTVAGKAA